MILVRSFSESVRPAKNQNDEAASENFQNARAAMGATQLVDAVLSSADEH